MKQSSHEKMMSTSVYAKPELIVFDNWKETALGDSSCIAGNVGGGGGDCGTGDTGTCVSDNVL